MAEISEDMTEITAEDVEIKVKDIPTELFKTVSERRVFRGTGLIGDGSLLALKIALWAVPNCVLVLASGSMTYVVTNKPTLHAGYNGAAAATGVSRVLKNNPVVCFAGDRATEKHFTSVLAAAKRNERFLYICANNFGGSITHHFRGMGSFVRHLRDTNAATASIAYPEDYIQKIKKCCESGFGFIDVLAPSPSTWGFETSNTVQLARLGVDTKIWPLYEVDQNNKVAITKIPKYFEPVDRFLDAQNRLRDTKQEDRENLQKRVDKFWKALTEGKMV